MGCFDGNIQFPLLAVDQGIDFFPDQSMTTQIHECTGSQYPIFKNTWRKVPLRMPDDMFDEILKDPAISRGLSKIAIDWRPRNEDN
jgi:hypothetical protein|tara:strand:+ start:1432 stop:1689 length:258 start_codon:yes stop_codon:yes gene_type:complete